MSNFKVWGACAVLCTAAGVSQASFHLTEIEMVIGGVKGNIRAQAIQLRMRQAGQDLLHQARIRVWDAAGANPVLIIAFPDDVSNGDEGDRTLITSNDFN